MKYSYRDMPEGMKGTFGDFSRSFGFSWKEFVVTVPSPLFLVTTYKANGQPNACMQSWATFTSADHGNGFYAVLASVNKNGCLILSGGEFPVLQPGTTGIIFGAGVTKIELIPRWWCL